MTAKDFRYLSPSALMSFEKDPEYFYKTRVLDHAKDEQTKPMVAGTGFDALVKEYIDPEVSAAQLIKDGVDSKELIDFAIQAGAESFSFYKNSGALASLMLEMQGSQPNVIGQVEREVGGVLLHGRPDLVFEKGPDTIVIDWKVNGFCSAASPAPGYLQLWYSEGGEKGVYKDAAPFITPSGITINAACCLEDANEDWATQLATYAWVLGIDVGDPDFIVGIDQIVWSKKHEPRCAKHRYRISPKFQFGLLARYQELWDKIQTGTILGSDTSARAEILNESLVVEDDWLKRER